MTGRDFLKGRRIPIVRDGHTHSGVIREVLGVSGAGQQLGIWLEQSNEMIYVSIPEDDERLQEDYPQ